MKEAKVLFIAQEITPYLPESEIANICRNLPQGIQDRGHEIPLCLSTVLLTSVVINCTR